MAEAGRGAGRGEADPRPHRDLDVVPGDQPIGLLWWWGACVLMRPVRGPGSWERVCGGLALRAASSAFLEPPTAGLGQGPC